MSLINQGLLCTSSSADAPIYVLLKCKKAPEKTEYFKEKMAYIENVIFVFNLINKCKM